MLLLVLRTSVQAALVGCLWLAAVPQGVWAAVGEFQHSYRFEVWTTERGLPQNTVLSIVQSRDGYLWIGTRFGLARFDGVRFTTFNVANTPGMPCENCYTMVEDNEGSLWIGTNEGLMRRKNNRFELFTTMQGLSHNTVRQVCQGLSGAIWAGTSEGFSRLLNGEFTNLLHAVGDIANRTEVLEDRSGFLWYNTHRGLFRMPLRTARPELVAPIDQPAGERARFFLEDAQGNIWYGNAFGLFRWSTNRLTRFKPEGVVAEFPTLVQVGFETRPGELWVSVSEKNVLYRFADGKFIPFTGPGGRPIEHVTCGLQDREGNIWVGTRYDGLIAAQHGVACVLTTRHGLGHDNVLSVSQGRSGTVWVGTSGGKVTRIRDLTVDSFEIPQAASWDVLSTFEDGSGTVWLGTRKGDPQRSLYRLRDGSLECVNAQAGLVSECISAIYQDRSGSLWFGTIDGLFRLKGEERQKFTTDNGLSTNNVRAILEDGHGALWVGTYGGGVNVLQNGRFRALTTKDGLGNDFAWALYEDRDGAMWIGTQAGLSRYRHGRFFTFTRKHGLFDDLVNCILEDDDANLWISCNRGIYRVSREDLDEVASGQASFVRHIAYGVSDGMLSSETNGENQPAGWKGRNGWLWFPTIEGLVCIDPRRARENTVPPAVVIEQVVVDDEVMLGNAAALPKHSARADGKDFTLAARRGRVMQIQYTANSFMAPDKVRFKYRLDGHDRDWRDAGADRVAYYTNLKPGDYRFRVIAANNHDVWNTDGATFAFSLAPHYTQTKIFWIGVGLVLGLIAMALHVLRLRFVRRLQRAEQFQAVEMERKRIAKDMHDDLGSSLTQISLLTELAERDARQPEEFRDHLGKISETTRKVFYSLDEIIWATNPRNDALESLVSYIAKYAQDFLRLANISCRLDLPQTLPALPVSAALRHDLLLAVKEALNNIVKHSGATEVWLRGTWAYSNLELTIRDNGCGLPRGNGHPPANGDGLLNMRQRLQTNGGEITVDMAPEGGTLVRMVIPISERYSPTMI